MSESVVTDACIYTLHEICLYVCVFFRHCASGSSRLQQFIRQLASSTRDELLVLLSIDLEEMLLPMEIPVCLSVRLSVFVSLLHLHVEYNWY